MNRVRTFDLNDAADQKKLPVEMQKLTHNEISERVARARDDRLFLQKQIAQISEARANYIAEETKHLAAAGKGDSFDVIVAQVIRNQAKKGISY